MVRKELKHIIVFEHQRLLVDQEGDTYISEKQHQALEAYYGNYSPFFSLIRNGVQFCEYVGVLQVGDTLIEILPKADKSADKADWRDLLVNMIRTVWGFPVRDSGTSSLKLKNNSVLDLYFELFIIELEKLMHLGLIKKYIRKEQNAKAMKGKLCFGKHIQRNLVHQERFYVETTTYNLEHELHRILYAALRLVDQLNANLLLSSRIGNLLLNFPEQKSIKVSSSTFSRIGYDRKSQPYKTALEIAELLLLNYHPDISKGNKHVLALLFDMNALWEQFVLRVLQRELQDFKVSGQVGKKFWKGESLQSYMRPDIVLTHESEKHCIVLDTKWKNLNGKGPSPEDLRQMYVYHEYFEATKVALVYPGEELCLSGSYYHKNQKELDDKHCFVIQIPANKNFAHWKKSVVERVKSFLV